MAGKSYIYDKDFAALLIKHGKAVMDEDQSVRG